jgi:hypothetical protein
MYAIARVADAIITAPFPSPQPITRDRSGDEEPPIRSTGGIRQGWRTIEHAAANAWIAFVPRMHNHPR